MLTGIAAAQGSADDVGGLFGLDDRCAFLSATWHSIADKASDCVGEKEKGHPLVKTFSTTVLLGGCRCRA